jgi:peptide/nickel transport system ATP-binding protein
MSEAVITAQHLALEYRIGGIWQNVVRDVSLTIHPLEIHGLVGESGSGKSTLGLALMGYLESNGRYTAGNIWFAGRDLTRLNAAEAQQLRGNQISFVPQNALDALNPALTIGTQMMELTQYHLGLTRQAAQQRACEALKQTRIADPEQVLQRYPHQLSGGMQQRVLIAMALSTRPRLLILDEPTTALDVTTQAVILDLVRELIVAENAAALYISHNLGTVAQLCDTVTVLYAGEVMESAPVKQLFAQPQHPYTLGLLASLPSAAQGQQSRLATIRGTAESLAGRSSACVFAARCPIAQERCFTTKPPLELRADGRRLRCWRADEIANGLPLTPTRPVAVAETLPAEASSVLSVNDLSKMFHDGSLMDWFMGTRSSVQALEQVSLTIRRQATFGLVGESGSGKTTLARVIVGLETGDSGALELLHLPLSRDLRQRPPEALRNIRLILQNPGEALNPYHTIGRAIRRTLWRLHGRTLSRAAIQQRLVQLLESVGLTAEYANRYPDQLSGGEKQRAAIARAFAAQPALIIADEPTSALDVSVQAVILNLLKDMRAQAGASYLFISHDLEVIGYLADWIGVMYLGEIVEQGTNEQVRQPPMHPYTEALLSAAPTPYPQATYQPIRLQGEVPSPRHKPTGCPFHTRCPRFIGQICVEQKPPRQITPEGHEIRCHIPLAELAALQGGTP